MSIINYTDEFDAIVGGIGQPEDVPAWHDLGFSDKRAEWEMHHDPKDPRTSRYASHVDFEPYWCGDCGADVFIESDGTCEWVIEHVIEVSHRHRGAGVAA